MVAGTAHVGRLERLDGRSRSRNRGANGSHATGARHESAAENKHVHVNVLSVPHFNVVPGQLLGPKRQYYVRRLLGEGTFGRVLSCIDTTTKRAVAVKVVKGVRRYCDYAEAEAQALREIQRCDPGKQSRCVQLLDAFHHPTHHYCLVFERLGVSLHEFMQKDCKAGLLAVDVQSMARQLLQCLCFLHGLGIAHTDLKCRNVMLRDPRYDIVPLPRAKGTDVRKPQSSEIVVIDFGGALFAAERGDGKVGTRHYRAPEVIVGLPWDEKADVWSVGCLVALTYIGFRPVSANEDLEQLALMERLVGQEFPRPMAREALRIRGVPPAPAIFNKTGKLQWPQRAPDAEAAGRVESAIPLRQLISAQHGPLLELLEGLLQIDPAKRLTAGAASDLPVASGEDGTSLLE
eukprot:TRINITY_DN69983_c0_g1_i1.p1 TRINITY_DN69983_c0_g1~~TRINITY_DN69983_c0_g1_i1.p1  ORF type:complete len:404 (+),score=44.49 TRINITY_DN69983_c0_g1_i1:97-1308(+)